MRKIEGLLKSQFHWLRKLWWLAPFAGTVILLVVLMIYLQLTSPTPSYTLF